LIAGLVAVFARIPEPIHKVIGVAVAIGSAAAFLLLVSKLRNEPDAQTA